MVRPPKFASPLDRADVGRLLHDANGRGVTPRIPADRAELLFGEIEAARAGTHTLPERQQRVRQPATLIRRLPKQVIRESKRRLPTDTGKPGELGREIVDCGHATT